MRKPKDGPHVFASETHTHTHTYTLTHITLIITWELLETLWLDKIPLFLGVY